MLGKKERFDNIDLLKTVAIFGVIVIHCFSLSIDFWKIPSAASYLNYFFRTVLALCVPVFFICNGYLLFSQELDLRKHIKKTVRCLVLTYIWGILTILFLMPLKNTTLSVGEMITMLREWQDGWVNHLWFMGALVRIYIIFPVLKLASKQNAKILLYYVITVMIFVTINKGLESVMLIEEENAWLRSFEIFDAYSGAFDWTYVYFGVGGILYFYQSKIKEFISRSPVKVNIACMAVIVISCGLLFGCGVFLSKVTGSHWDVVWDGYDMPFTFFAAVSAFLLSLNYKKKKENLFSWIIQKVSVNTLGIYFVHMIVGHGLALLCPGIFGTNTVPALLLRSLFVLSVSTAITLLAKKIPVVRQLV